jgi:hypothetical protein
MDKAERWLALTDGGSGLENFVDVNFPNAVKILDFQHASEYANDFAKVYCSGSKGDELAQKLRFNHKWRHNFDLGGLSYQLQAIL